MSPLPDPESLIAEQLAFYRADAAAYAAWEEEVFARGGGGTEGEAARAERRRLRSVLRGLAPRGRVLELAAGTGTWTGALLETATEVTAVDGSPESLALARSRLGPQAERVRFVEADLFAWQPRRRYDEVFFAFWLSHVPPGRFEDFWGLVRRALAPHGRVLFFDSAGADAVRSADDAPTREVTSAGSRYREWDWHERSVSVRELDGRRYHVVKVVWRPAELEERLDALGWEARVRRTASTIQGEVRPRRARS